MNHIMVDLETFATTADATILSIGAVRFDLEGTIIGDEAFYRSVSIDQDRRVSNDTVAWWMKQARSAQSVFHEKKGKPSRSSDGVSYLGYRDRRVRQLHVEQRC